MNGYPYTGFDGHRDFVNKMKKKYFTGFYWFEPPLSEIEKLTMAEVRNVRKEYERESR